ncbi:hypothetical protein ES703_04672 [subsurface metagenome]
MIVSSYQETKAVQELPGVVKREVVCADKGAPNFCMRVFDVEPGSSTPSHEHAWEHEVYVLSGQGVAVGEQGEIPIAKDSCVFVPPNEHHCFINNGSEILRIICVIPIVS